MNLAEYRQALRDATDRHAKAVHAAQLELMEVISKITAEFFGTDAVRAAYMDEGQTERRSGELADYR